MKNGRCYYCEREFNIAHYGSNRALAKTKDHIIPRSRGGINKSPNLVPCCSECNGFKGAMMPEWHLNKTILYINKAKRYKTLSVENLKMVQKNIQLLIENVVNKEGSNLFVKHFTPPTKKERRPPKWAKPFIPLPQPTIPTEVWTQEKFDEFFKGQEHFHYFAP